MQYPLVMGIVNVTPDSFYAASRIYADAPHNDTVSLLRQRARQVSDEGGRIIDVGACSTRPGASDVSAAEEMRRLRQAVPILKAAAPDLLLSVDTWRADVARCAVEELGADIVNDISGGTLDPQMLPTVARLGKPYILMHTRGTPQTMGCLTDYGADDARLLDEVQTFLARRMADLRALGHDAEIVVDPGYGFAKDIDQNYRLLARQAELKLALGCRLLVGVSRKRMIWQLLGTDADHALNGTTVVNTLALLQGADILRVHDVRQAAEAVAIVERLRRVQATPNV